MGIFKAQGSSGFIRMPEGHQVLGVKKVEFDPAFFTDTTMIVEVYLQNENGITHKERFNVATEGGSKAFTFLVKTANNNFAIKEGEDLDPYVESMVGKFIECDVVWEEAKDKDGNPIKTKKGEQVINVRLNEKKPTDASFEMEVEEVSIDEDDEDYDDETGDETVDAAEGFEF
jgi:hypothetical protein